MTPPQNTIDQSHRNGRPKSLGPLIAVVMLASSLSMPATGRVHTRAKAQRAATPSSSNIANSSLAIRQRQASLEKRLRNEEHRLEKQKRQRETLAQVSGPSEQTAQVEPEQTRDAPPVQAIRQQLETARGRLPALQITDTDLHPDVISVREQIAALEQKLRETNATSATAARAHAEISTAPQSDRGSSLAQFDASISAQENKIEDDKRELDGLKHAAQVPPTRRAAESRSPKGFLQPARDLSTGTPISQHPPSKSAPSRVRRVHTRTTIGAISGLMILGFFFGLFIVLRRGPRRAIQDGAALQEMLPIEIDYVGSIPRMKAG